MWWCARKRTNSQRCVTRVEWLRLTFCELLTVFFSLSPMRCFSASCATHCAHLRPTFRFSFRKIFIYRTNSNVFCTMSCLMPSTSRNPTVYCRETSVKYNLKSSVNVRGNSKMHIQFHHIEFPRGIVVFAELLMREFCLHPLIREKCWLLIQPIFSQFTSHWKTHRATEWYFSSHFVISPEKKHAHSNTRTNCT